MCVFVVAVGHTLVSPKADTNPDFIRVPSREVVMAVLLFLLAIAGGVLVGDLVLENTAAGSVTVMDRSFTGYSQGQLLAAVAAVGFMVGVLVVGSVSLRRARRVRRRELRRAEHDLSAEVDELERENTGLRDELARRAQRRPGAGAMPPPGVAPGSAPSAGERRARAYSAPPDRHPEPVYDEARRVARLRSRDVEP
jgi:uncharacterized membrane protein YciS (DUF1049 family)